ncbi:MAG: gliding motility-associated C-terminal domain-containing protein, partial [Chitinophagales bacterium]|nr:gliding motility-associated C-terminal domain-containing protein [Chitinophagales bacterium]
IEALINLLPSELDTIIWESSELVPCPDCLIQTLKPDQTADYNILLVNEDGCVAEDNLRINVLKERAVYIPSAFSPNGDGVNDFFTIYAGPEVAQIRKLLIFDRWGASVFKAENFQPNEEQFGWDGFFRGEMLNPGVWTYWTEVEFIDGFVKLYKGDVTIIK